MPPPPLIDLASLDLSRREAGRDEIYASLPHRHEFMMLDGILLMDLDRGVGVAIKEVRPEDWWVRGHIPGRPLFPGVLMIEASAQLASYYVRVKRQDDRFMGFAGIDNAKFRDAVIPPADLIIVNKLVHIKSRRFIMDTQEFVNQKMVFEARITGMIV